MSQRMRNNKGMKLVKRSEGWTLPPCGRGPEPDAFEDKTIAKLEAIGKKCLK